MWDRELSSRAGGGRPGVCSVFSNKHQTAAPGRPLAATYGSLRLRSVLSLLTLNTLTLTHSTGNTCYLDINGAASSEDAGQYKCVLADQVDMTCVSD